jgi:hypothetical protein
MLPLLARKRSGKSIEGQEQFMNKSHRPAVIEGWRLALTTGQTLAGRRGWMLLASVRSCVVAGVVALASLWLLGWPEGPAVSVAQDAGAAIWTVPEIGALPNDANGSLVRRGRDLITATYAHIGPEVADRAKRFAGNNLACGNCHLQAGTKKFGIPLFGLFGAFPRYSARLGAEMTIQDRLNACMTRSMNGRPLPVDSPEMQALVAYNWRPARAAAAGNGHGQYAGARLGG